MILKNNSMIEEEWRDVPEYEGLYQASNLGRIMGLARGVHTIVGSNGFKGNVKKLYLNKDGYYHASITKNKKNRTVHVHKIIAITFLNHKPSGMIEVVNHIDGDKTNNSVANLELVTSRENLTTCYRSDKELLTSSYAGVYWDSTREAWCSAIQNDKVRRYLGHFHIEVDAHNAYQWALANINDDLYFDIYKKVKDSKLSCEYVGVTKIKKTGMYQSTITINKKYIHLGNYELAIDASNAYNKAKENIDNPEYFESIKPKWTSKHKGVHYNSAQQRWISTAKNDKKVKYVGSYLTEELAYEAQQAYIKEHNLDPI